MDGAYQANPNQTEYWVMQQWRLKDETIEKCLNIPRSEKAKSRTLREYI